MFLYVPVPIISYYPNRALCSKRAGLFEVPRLSTVDWDADPSAIRHLSCGTSSQFGFGKKIPSLICNNKLKTSF